MGVGGLLGLETSTRTQAGQLIGSPMAAGPIPGSRAWYRALESPGEAGERDPGAGLAFTRLNRALKT